jgi:hypothetical protein
MDDGVVEHICLDNFLFFLYLKDPICTIWAVDHLKDKERGCQ